MNPNYEKQLEAVISRELKALPELAAPPSLVNRVMTALEQCSRIPVYHRSWQTWPVVWQAASFAVLLALFGGLCLGGWELSQAKATALALHRVEEWLSGLSMIGNTVNVLVNAALLALKKLGTGVIVAGLVIVGLGYAMCVGLGSIYFRLAFASRQESCL